MAIGTSVLYYPHIEISDTNWLKTALLLWDNVYRIVPPSYAPLDSDDTKIATDAGLVRAVKLEQADLRGIVSAFQQFLQSLPEPPRVLRRLQLLRRWSHEEIIEVLT